MKKIEREIMEDFVKLIELFGSNDFGNIQCEIDHDFFNKLLTEQEYVKNKILKKTIID